MLGAGVAKRARDRPSEPKKTERGRMSTWCVRTTAADGGTSDQRSAAITRAGIEGRGQQSEDREVMP